MRSNLGLAAAAALLASPAWAAFLYIAANSDVDLHPQATASAKP